MTRKGQVETGARRRPGVLGASADCSARSSSSSPRRRSPTIALEFSSFEYFWLVLLGLTAAVFVSPGSPIKALVSLMLGLLIASVGFENPAAYPRFTFGSVNLMSGFQLIPVMIGMFAVSEVVRYAVSTDSRVRGAEAGHRPDLQGARRTAARLPAAPAPRQRRRHRSSARCRAPARTSRRGSRMRSPSGSRRRRRSSAPATSKGSSRLAPPTMPRCRARGFRRWCSAFRATRSPRS